LKAKKISDIVNEYVEGNKAERDMEIELDEAMEIPESEVSPTESEESYSRAKSAVRSIEKSNEKIRSL
jgi:hypothetical protein